MTEDHEQPADEAQAGTGVTEAAREFAAANMVDLEEITGTGADGKITKADVEDHLAKTSAAAAPTAQASPEPETAAAAEPAYQPPASGHAPKVWTGPAR